MLHLILLQKDPVNMAGYVAENILNGKVKIKHWRQNAQETLNGTVYLDVRTKDEFELGSIPELLTFRLMN